MVGFALFGQFVLEYLNVSVQSLSIVGGLLLLLVAAEMLRGMDAPEPSKAMMWRWCRSPRRSAGPGAIAMVIVLNQQNPGMGERAAVMLGALGAVVVVGLVFLFAERLGRLLSPAIISF